MSGSGVNTTIDLSYVHWDELTPGDWVANAFLLLSAVFILTGVVVIAWKRNYPPMKAKQPSLLIPLGLAGSLACLGIATGARTLPQQGALLFDGGCTIFGMWVLFILGYELAFIMLLFRLIRLYFVFNMKRVPPFWGQVIIFAIMFAYPLIGQGIIGTALNVNGPNIENGVPTCGFGTTIYALNVGYFVCLFLVFLFLAIKLRNVPKRAFSDYRQNVLIIVYLIVTDLIFLGMTLSHAYLTVAGRVIQAFVGVFSLCGTWIMLTGPILYHTIVHPDAHLIAFSNDLANVSYVDKAAASASNLKPSSKSSTQQSAAAVSPNNTAITSTTASIELTGVLADAAQNQVSLAESEIIDA